MEPNNFHRQAVRIRRICRRLYSSLAKSERTTIYEDMEMGAVTGFFACTAMTLYFAGGELTAAMLILLSSLGILFGAIIGAVLWISAATLPEDVVLNPGPGQGRSDRERRP